MPELPEVEVVRSGLERHVVGRRVTRVEVIDPRPLRRQDGGAEAFVRGLEGRVLTAAVRRGKFLWLPTDDGRALSAHLGMSGQLLVRGTGAPRCEPAPAQSEDRANPADPAAPAHPAHLAREGERVVDLTATRAPSLVRELSVHPRHLRIRLHLSTRLGESSPGRGDPGEDGGAAALDLVDQRMLGGLQLAELVPTDDGAPGGVGSASAALPAHAAHIARDLLDPALDRERVVERLRASRRAVKTLLLDQALVAGIGNIYADEGLWGAGVHGLRPGSALRPVRLRRLLEATAEVMRRALAVGGTSFDSLYVDAEGAAGFFARSLEAYGRSGRPCSRCTTPMRAEVVGGRSHTFCPRCQTRPRR